MKLHTTLNLLRENNACASGYRKLLGTVGHNYDRDAKIDLLTVLDSNGLQDALWALCATSNHVFAACISVDFARFCAMNSGGDRACGHARMAGEYALRLAHADIFQAQSIIKVVASLAGAAANADGMYERQSDEYTRAMARKVEKLKELLS